jgi:hypothetical protein
VSRVRRNWLQSLLWSSRITIAATASYVAALVAFPGTQPLLAPLTAMLVVQVTPVSLLTAGLDRVVSVVAGVALAVGFASVVPLAWWSLGLLIFVSIALGQLLRLRGNLIEVAISAMLVLGVGSLGAPAAAWQRITETLVGAAVGVLTNLVFPTKIGSSDAGKAIDGLADRVSGLLSQAADELDEIAADHDDRDRLRPISRAWLIDARRITHDIPQVGAALHRAEEGRRLNVRAVSTPPVEAGLRQGLEALEHTAVAVRSLMRAVADACNDGALEDGERTEELTGLARTFREMSAGVDAFGELVRNEADVQVQLSGPDVERLRESIEGLRQARDRLDDAVAGGPGDLLELHSFARSTVRRVIDELDLGERVRRQVQLARPRARLPRPPSRRRPRQGLWEPAGPDDETQAIPVLSELPLEDDETRPEG